MLPYIVMDPPIFVIAEWATLLVDIRCPRGGSQLSIPIHFSGLAALTSADIARNLWSLVCSCLNSYCTFSIFSHFWCFKKYVGFCTGFNLLTLIFMLPYIVMDPLIYPSKLAVEKANKSDHLADYLDLTFIIDSGDKLTSRLYDC